jgi:hypothetical protein
VGLPGAKGAEKTPVEENADVTGQVGHQTD